MHFSWLKWIPESEIHDNTGKSGVFDAPFIISVARVIEWKSKVETY
jgi:hypothetical protein